MRYKIGDREFSVRFRYDQHEPHAHGVGTVDYVEGRGEETKVLASYEGRAECSDMDTFSRREGRHYSLIRAMAKIDAPKDDKRAFWKAYFARTTKEPFRP